MEAADYDSPILDPLWYPVKCFEEYVAGTYLRGDETEQRFRQER